jgi:hypothetical protein
MSGRRPELPCADLGRPLTLNARGPGPIIEPVDDLLLAAPLAVAFLLGLIARRGHRRFAVAGLAPALALTVWALVDYSGDTNRAMITGLFVLVGVAFWAAWSAAVGAGLVLRRLLARSHS